MRYRNKKTFQLSQKRNIRDIKNWTLNEKIKQDSTGRTVFEDAERTKPIIEVVSFPDGPLKYIKFDDSIDPKNYFSTSPYKVISEADKEIVDLAETEMIKRQPKSRDQIFNEVETIIASSIDTTDKTTEEIHEEKELMIELMFDSIESKKLTAFIMALDGYNYKRSRRILSKISQLPQNVVDAFENVIPIT